MATAISRLRGFYARTSDPAESDRLLTDYDPVTAEVIQSRLVSIVNEMATTLVRTSGSPVLTEAKDLCTAIFDEQVEHIAFSGYVITHIGSCLVGVQSVLKQYGRDQIHPGDAFIVNDPHTSGALHQGDIGIISPLFYRDDVVGWAFSNAHVLDVGGMSPGGWAPEARDCFAEGLRFPAMKVADRGKFNNDLLRFIMANVRVPVPVANDIKSLTAANITAQRRLTELIDRFGLADYRRYVEINKALSERAVRQRIARIPDGTYRTEDWMEYDGRGENWLAPVQCELTIDGTDLTVDFSGSHPQTDTFGNAGPGALLGIVGTVIMLNLAYDIPINAGVFRPVRVDMGEAGTVTNPQVPAAVSCSHMEATPKAGRAMTEALVRAMQLSDDPGIRSRCAALGGYVWPGNAWVGKDQYGQYAAFAIMDCGSVGLGAQSTGDGLDISAYEVMLNNSIPDVEINEGLYPVLYLWRSIYRGSGGPGMHRGGQGMDLCWIPYGTDRLIGTLENACAQVPSRGALGGLPGSTSLYIRLTGASAPDVLAEGRRVPVPADLDGHAEVLSNHIAHVPLLQGQVFRQFTGGGGGYGDPLLRQSDRVAADVRDGWITVTQARAAYGVVLDPAGRADEAATAALRAEIRRSRLGREPTRTACGTDTGVRLVHDGGDRHVACAGCGERLGPVSANWRTAADMRETDLARRLAEVEVRIQPRRDPELVLRECFCPGCAAVLETTIAIAGSPLPADTLK